MPPGRHGDCGAGAQAVPRRAIGDDVLLQGTIDSVGQDGKFGFIIGPNGEEYFFHKLAPVE